MNVQAYYAALRELVAMFGNGEMACNVEEKAARMFGMITSAADDDMCQIVGQFVVDVMKAQRAREVAQAEDDAECVDRIAAAKLEAATGDGQ
jgi:hypothetical protein